jgi:hypothetical protein
MKCRGDVARAGGVRVVTKERGKLRLECEVIRVVRVQTGIRAGRWDSTNGPSNEP